MLKVKLLHPDAKAPTVGHPGEDLGADLYALEGAFIGPLEQKKIRTGVSIEFDPPAGAVVADRSSMANIYALVVGKIIDPGYRGEIIVTVYNRHSLATLEIKKGSKFAQLLKYPNLVESIGVVSELSDSERKDAGFGSTDAS